MYHLYLQQEHVLICVVEVHSAKTFRVHYSWTRPEKENINRPAGFRVPDDDEIETVSIDGSSDEDTPIIESRPRKYSNTYSVPSSDDEGFQSSDVDDEVAVESVSDDIEEISAPTTPGSKTSATSPKKDSANGERRELNLKGPSLQELLNKGPSEGSSQQNPIELDDLPAKAKQIDDTESEVEEDDGPEIFPTHGSSPPPRPQRPLPGIMNVAINRTFYADPRAQHVVPETQAKDTSSQREMVETAYDSMDDEDVDDEDESDDDAFSPYPPVPEAPLIANAALPKSTPTEEHNHPSTSSYALQASEILDVSRGGANKPPYQRTPSPSDAALAKKAPGNQTRKDAFGLHDMNAVNGFDQYKFPFDTISEPFDQPSGYNYGPDPPYSAYSPTTQEWMRKSAPVPTTDRSHFGFIPLAEHSHGTWEPSYTDVLNQTQHPFQSFRYERHYPELPKLNTQERESAKPHRINPPAQAEQESSQKQSSRLNISNLINDGHTSQQEQEQEQEQAQSLKRKLEEISSDEEENTYRKSEASFLSKLHEYTTHAEPIATIQESQLHDAQVPDAPINPPSTLDSQIESSEPLISSNITSTIVERVQSEEPPRKKIKTVSSSSRVGGIAKFVSGVAVGVVGVIATIIATAPASVHEEALREVTMML